MRRRGAKQLLVGDQAFAYDTGRVLLHPFDVPASSQALEASPKRPCAGSVLKLDLRVMAELISPSGLPPPRECANGGHVHSAP